MDLDTIDHVVNTVAPIARHIGTFSYVTLTSLHPDTKTNTAPLDRRTYTWSDMTHPHQLMQASFLGAASTGLAALIDGVVAGSGDMEGGLLKDVFTVLWNSLQPVRGAVAFSMLGFVPGAISGYEEIMNKSNPGARYLPKTRDTALSNGYHKGFQFAKWPAGAYLGARGVLEGLERLF